MQFTLSEILINFRRSSKDIKKHTLSFDKVGKVNVCLLPNKQRASECELFLTKFLSLGRVLAFMHLDIARPQVCFKSVVSALMYDFCMTVKIPKLTYKS